jgi:hypothetical protein
MVQGASLGGFVDQALGALRERTGIGGTFDAGDHGFLDERLDRTLEGAVTSTALQALTMALLLRFTAAFRLDNLAFFTGFFLDCCGHDLLFLAHLLLIERRMPCFAPEASPSSLEAAHAQPELLRLAPSFPDASFGSVTQTKAISNGQKFSLGVYHDLDLVFQRRVERNRGPQGRTYRTKRERHSL